MSSLKPIRFSLWPVSSFSRMPGRGRLFLLISLAAVFLVLSGCKVVILSGPSIVQVGDLVTYELEISHEGATFEDNTLFVLADIPVGWMSTSGTFDGTITGEPVAGTLTISDSTVCDELAGPTQPGFKRLYFTAGPLTGLVSSDTATVTLGFDVQDQPVGEYTIAFRFVGLGYSNMCSSPEARRINRRIPPGLEVLETFFDNLDGIEGLEGASEVELSPDGSRVYVGARGLGSLAVFSRAPGTGSLMFVEAHFDGVGGVDGLDAVQAIVTDEAGENVYIASREDDGIAIFEQGATGLSFVSSVHEGVDGFRGLGDILDLEIFEADLYSVSSEGIGHFMRDPLTGTLSFNSLVPSTISGCVFTCRFNHLAMSPDGQYLYTYQTAESSIVIFSRGPLTGALSFVGTFSQDEGGPNLSHVANLVVSPDGGHLYTISIGLEGEILYLERDVVSGSLSLAGSRVIAEDVGVHGGQALVVSPDGRKLFAVGLNGVLMYQRNLATGELTFIDVHFSGDASSMGLAGATELALSPDGHHLYIASLIENALVNLQVTILVRDGFESGDASAWFPVVP